MLTSTVAPVTVSSMSRARRSRTAAWRRSSFSRRRRLRAAGSAPVVLIASTPENRSPMKAVTPAPSSRAWVCHRLMTSPSARVATMAAVNGSTRTNVTNGSIEYMMANAATVKTVEPARSIQRSTMMTRSSTSSRNRLTASPVEPGSRFDAGPGAPSSERRTLPRIRVATPFHQ